MAKIVCAFLLILAMISVIQVGYASVDGTLDCGELCGFCRYYKCCSSIWSFKSGFYGTKEEWPHYANLDKKNSYASGGEISLRPKGCPPCCAKCCH